MKKILLLLLTFLTNVILCQEVIGTWHGLLDVGQKLRLVLHVSKSEDGYIGKLDSPDQGAKDILASKTEFIKNVLLFEVKNLGVSYTGELINDSIIGTFKQGSFTTKMVLTRSQIEVPKVNRPQEPKKPFKYLEEEITFTNKIENFKLSGTLTLPKGNGPFPAVILISGSGPQDRNEEILNHKPFWIIADYLTNQGFAVLRYDDRGTANSEGNFSKATSVELAQDAESALDYLKTNSKINNSKISLIGHSEGGMLAVLLAARRKDLHSIALLAGPAIPGGELLLKQQYLINQANGVSKKSNKAMQKINKQIYDIVLKESNMEIAKPMIEKKIRDVLKNTKDNELSGYSSKEQLIQESITNICNPWMYYFIRYNPKNDLEKVSCHILALNGNKDLQVPAKENLEAMAKFLPISEKSRVIKELPNLNHLFQECETGNPQEYGKIEQTIQPEVLKIMGDWLLSIQTK